MNSYCFCTVITKSHLAWAFALNASLKKTDANISFYILVTDTSDLGNEHYEEFPDTKFLFLDDIKHLEIGNKIMDKYKELSDELRWSLKPVLMAHLLETHDKVAFCDCDLFFYNDYRFLLDELETSSVILTPHWRSSKATVNRTDFDLLYVGGLYNAGFVAASKKGVPALLNWAENCEQVCIKDSAKGQFVDQTHLNLLPIYFENVKPLKHRGCNVANWNLDECVRTSNEKGEVLINQKFPVVFIHFTRSTMIGIMSGTDPLLFNCFKEYSETMKRYKPDLDFMQKITNELEQDRIKVLKKQAEQEARLKEQATLAWRVKNKIRWLKNKLVHS